MSDHVVDWNLIFVVAGAIVGMLILLLTGVFQSSYKEHPCSEYANSPLSQVPVRCFEELMGSEANQ
jgi:hypothetical protein